MTLAARFIQQLALPLIAAPMTGVSSVELTIECCRNGVIGSFPTHSAPTPLHLHRWLDAIDHARADADTETEALFAPVAPNLVVHPSNPRLHSDIEAIVEHHCDIVITSVGSPAHVVEPLHAGGCAVYADVATMHHAERAIELGVDGLVLLTAGAGGQTGWNNPFAFVRAVREKYDGTIVLAGGIGDGHALLAALALGADLAYMGTRFIATQESAASNEYRNELIKAGLDDIGTTLARTGLPANFLRTWLKANQLDHKTEPNNTPTFDLAEIAAAREWAAGHSVYTVTDIPTTAELISRTKDEFNNATKNFNPTTLHN